MKNWCSENPKNEGHENLHPNRDSFIRIDVPIGAPEGSGPPGMIAVCKHCRLLYFTDVIPNLSSLIRVDEVVGEEEEQDQTSDLDRHLSSK